MLSLKTFMDIEKAHNLNDPFSFQIIATPRKCSQIYSKNHHKQTKRPKSRKLNNNKFLYGSKRDAHLSNLGHFNYFINTFGITKSSAEKRRQTVISHFFSFKSWFFTVLQWYIDYQSVDLVGGLSPAHLNNKIIIFSFSCSSSF